MNYQIREMLPEDGTRVLEIFKQGIDGGNATFDKEIPSWISEFVMKQGNKSVISMFMVSCHYATSIFIISASCITSVK